MKIANAIAGLVKDYMQEYSGECRVAVGLTDGIALSMRSYSVTTLSPIWLLEKPVLIKNGSGYCRTP